MDHSKHEMFTEYPDRETASMTFFLRKRSFRRKNRIGFLRFRYGYVSTNVILLSRQWRAAAANGKESDRQW